MLEDADPIINKNDVIKKSHIDWGLGADQVSAIDVPISDSGGIITATEVENALQENRTAINLNTTHRSSDGSDHSYIDQDVTTTSSPTFDGASFTSGIDVEGSSDEIQADIKGHSTQTNYLARLRQNDDTVVATIANSGETIIGSGTLGGSLGGGVLTLLETTTPSALANYGKFYTKNDNKAYFQDGAGAEHELAFV